LSAIDEAVRNLVVVGGDPDRVALLDNFCWGDPTRPDRLGGLVRAVQGCVDGARAYAMPFISGKDSLFNEFNGEAIPGTLLISAIGLIPDLELAVTSAGARAGDDLWMVGSGSNDLGGSLVDQMLGLGATAVPAPADDPLPRYRAVHQAIMAGLVTSAHDCSEGGLAVAVAEMAIASRHGFDVAPPGPIDDPLRTFTNESPGRILLTSASTDHEALAARLGDHGVLIGTVRSDESISFRFGSTSIEVEICDAVEAFTTGSAL